MRFGGNNMANPSSQAADYIRLANAGLFDFFSFESPASDPEERSVRSKCVFAELSRILLGRLSPSETQLWQSFSANDDITVAALVEKLDDVIIEQAATLGWRLLESCAVVARIAAWKVPGNAAP